MPGEEIRKENPVTVFFKDLKACDLEERLDFFLRFFRMWRWNY